jgi:phage-related protein
VAPKWEIETEAEVETWIDSLVDRDFHRVRYLLDLLAERGDAMRMPLSRNLKRGLRELRFDLENKARRITYWITSERRIVLLTTFHKQRDNERAEIDRARAAMERCRAEQHTADE